MWPDGFGNLHANWSLTINNAHWVTILKNLAVKEICLTVSNPGFPKLIGHGLPFLRNPILGLAEWEVLSTFSCHQLGECGLKATRPDSPGSYLDGAVASGARLAFLGPPHYMPFLEWPLRSAPNQPSLPSRPARETGQAGLNLASPLTSRGAPQTHLHFSSVKWAHIHPPHRVAVRTPVLLVVPTQHQSVEANTEKTAGTKAHLPGEHIT